jgi:hypothetical protein
VGEGVMVGVLDGRRVNVGTGVLVGTKVLVGDKIIVADGLISGKVSIVSVGATAGSFVFVEVINVGTAVFVIISAFDCIVFVISSTISVSVGMFVGDEVGEKDNVNLVIVGVI